MIYSLRGVISFRICLLIFSSSCIAQDKTGLPKENGSTALTTDSNTTSYGPGDIVQCLMVDRKGNVWIGGSGGEGVYSFSPVTGMFTNYTVKDGLCSTEVGSIFEDSKGIIWFGTEEGACRYDPLRHNASDAQEQNGFTSFAIPPKAVNVMPDVNQRPNVVRMTSLVTDILEDQSGNMWFGTLNHGIYSYNPKSEKVTNFLSTEVIKCMYEDRDANIWAGSWSNGGIFYYNPKKNGADFTWKDGPNDGMIASIFQDSRGDIWFGTRDNGVCRYNSTTDKFTYVNEKSGLCNNNISCILEDQEGNIWFGSAVKSATNPGGICRYEPGVNAFTSFIPKAGLENSDIFCSVMDKTGNLWFGGRYGRLFCYQVTSGKFIDYSSSIHTP